jgi:hypothetical protein
MLDDVDVEIADIFLLVLHLIDEKGTAAKIKADFRLSLRLVHRQHPEAIAVDSLAIAQRFVERLAQYNAHIFNEVVVVHIDVAAGLDLEIEQRVLGEAFNEALGDRKGINRYGFWVLPMDEAQAQADVCLDLGGRPSFVYNMEHEQKYIRDFDVTIIKHFWRSFCDSAKMNLHIELKYGEDLHHCIEAIFKAVARALRMACGSDPRALDMIPSSKGRIGA